MPKMMAAALLFAAGLVLYTSATDGVTGRAHEWAKRNHVSGEARCYSGLSTEGYQRCTVGAIELHCTDAPVQGCHRASDHHGATSTSTGSPAASRQ